MTQKFMFAPRHRDLLDRHKAVLESFGCVCTVEQEKVAGYELLVLVAEEPKKENPIRFTKATDYEKTQA